MSLYLNLLDVVATRENVVRLEFNLPVYLSGLGDAQDGTLARFYRISALGDARPVEVLYAAATDTGNPATVGMFVDVVVDRAFSPCPALYQFELVSDPSFNSIVTHWPLADGEYPYYTAFQPFNFLGLTRASATGAAVEVYAGRDIASGRVAPAPGEHAAAGFGSFAYDNTGDYAHDDAETGLRKRLHRRLFSRPGAYAHLGLGYGLGLGAYGKKLLLAGVRAQLAAEAEAQAVKEPEVLRAKVQWRDVPGQPGLLYLVLLARTRARGTLRFEVPVRVGV